MKLIKEIFVPLKIESENEFIFSPTKIKFSKKLKRNCSVNYKYINYYNKWQKALTLLLPRQEERPTKKRLIKVIHYKPGRKYDHSNLVGGAKPIPDILKKINWIYDDSPEWFKDEYEQVKTNKDFGTKISIYECEEDEITTEELKSEIDRINEEFTRRLDKLEQRIEQLREIQNYLLKGE